MANIESRCFSMPWSVNACESEFEHDYAYYWGAFAGDALVAYAGLHVVIDEGHITNVAVLPEFRRLGLARTLVDIMLRCDLRLFTLEVRESNSAAISLYEKFGFEVLGKRKGYYDKPKEDALIMTKINEKHGC
ncbi:MAG: ribosomal protein S18-alanine N-acetyltransferase [Oscillospiraceae bacterium]|nr:ribosomal protein S18-alanine N-acetyltransferase [Oscillospiraceae bacterium]